MHRRVDGRHVEVTCGRGRRGQSSFAHPDRAGAEWGPRPEKVKAASGPCQAPGRGGPGGPGVGVGQLGGGTSATAHSKDARSAVRGARACKTFLPVRSSLWHAVSRRQRSTLGSRSPCVRTARSHLPRILNRERTDCPSAEARSRRSPLCGGREPIRLHVQKPRLPRGINRVEQEAEKWM